MHSTLILRGTGDQVYLGACLVQRRQPISVLQPDIRSSVQPADAVIITGMLTLKLYQMGDMRVDGAQELADSQVSHVSGAVQAGGPACPRPPVGISACCTGCGQWQCATCSFWPKWHSPRQTDLLRGGAAQHPLDLLSLHNGGACIRYHLHGGELF